MSIYIRYKNVWVLLVRKEKRHTHTHTHTFPSSLCSQSKTQENTLSPLYLLCLILHTKYA